ncbi:3-methyl-2-oxobutanoate hydroxymethyltransferase [Zunongwangia sp. F363]|uniref:3-methyl-2-oxobutanoate hydroxymethyltransferase n=1 Tax=Autumnicola tepida TaxID=3075595 RepID=A0ABU3CFQ1_9FLAO|nr:3-methyl-2-oxobutanoate hydroxymethyltransferase [Zunongwangia sp. F363]MDT0644830.1 3-methyl-2-oxobutanoate hydroxymethyltransferase [Zunongwangia sp. F363]
MSLSVNKRKITIPDLQSQKGRGRIVCLTAYTTPVARLMDPYVDMILVGDSLAMVAYGMESTMKVSLEMMIAHTRAVVKGASRACVIADMPFGSYEKSPEQAFKNASRLLAESGASGVKIEAGFEMLPTIRFLTQRGIPVTAHIGLLPQRANQYGGFRIQGRTGQEREELVKLAKNIEMSGAPLVLVEGVVESVAREIVNSVAIPVIGIGASPVCDGQVLVTDDILGLFSDFTPKFVKKYAHLSEEMENAFKNFAEEVRSGDFPTMEYCFKN